MKGLIKFVCQVSPSRVLILFVLFCACCLSSCAAGEVAEVIEPPRDGGGSLQDRPSNEADHSASTSTNMDAAIVSDGNAVLSDNVIASPDRFSTVSITVDASMSATEVGRVDGSASFLDAPSSFEMDAVSTVDTPRPSPVDGSVADATMVMSTPDAISSMPDVRPPPDVISPPDVRPAMEAPPRPVEICNGRDDDGNGFVDEIFECSVGRRGSTCVTVCRANGYQLCNTSCRWDPVCQTYPEDCDDTIDNDCNGRIDCADSACTSDPRCRPPPPPTVDAGTMSVDAGMVVVDAARTDGCHDLVVRLDRTRLPGCPSGWVAILYDSEGHPHESAPGEALTFTICGRLRGVLILSTRCGGDYLLDWPGSVGRPANAGGVASITLDGNELADREALLCLDRWSPTPGIRPAIPLEPTPVRLKIPQRSLFFSAAGRFL